MAKCLYPSCKDTEAARGYCRSHYRKVYSWVKKGLTNWSLLEKQKKARPLTRHRTNFETWVLGDKNAVRTRRSFKKKNIGLAHALVDYITKQKTGTTKTILRDMKKTFPALNTKNLNSALFYLPKLDKNIEVDTSNHNSNYLVQMKGKK